MATLELYGAARCPFTRELRDWLEFTGQDFVEYDVDADPLARRRCIALSGGQRSVPVLIDSDKVVSIGWQGQACMVEAD